MPESVAHAQARARQAGYANGDVGRSRLRNLDRPARLIPRDPGRVLKPLRGAIKMPRPVACNFYDDAAFRCLAVAGKTAFVPLRPATSLRQRRTGS